MNSGTIRRQRLVLVQARLAALALEMVLALLALEVARWRQDWVGCSTAQGKHYRQLEVSAILISR